MDFPVVGKRYTGKNTHKFYKGLRKYSAKGTWIYIVDVANHIADILISLHKHSLTPLFAPRGPGELCLADGAHRFFPTEGGRRFFTGSADNEVQKTREENPSTGRRGFIMGGSRLASGHLHRKIIGL
uniref:Uncharacterized protein n=1 Tax=Phlebotomus papatasi TaxID=29031 RepID=A0A1B0GP03_PHLPP